MFPDVLYVVALILGLIMALRWSLGQAESRPVGLLGYAIVLTEIGLLWGRLT